MTAKDAYLRELRGPDGKWVHDYQAIAKATTRVRATTARRGGYVMYGGTGSEPRPYEVLSARHSGSRSAFRLKNPDTGEEIPVTVKHGQYLDYIPPGRHTAAPSRAHTPATATRSRGPAETTPKPAAPSPAPAAGGTGMAPPGGYEDAPDVTQRSLDEARRIVDTAGLSPAEHEVLSRELARNLDKVPAMQGVLKHVNLNANLGATAITGPDEITFNPKYIHDPGLLNRGNKAWQDSGYLVRNVPLATGPYGGLRYTMTHEFGHAVTWRAAHNKDSSGNAKTQRALAGAIAGHPFPTDNAGLRQAQAVLSDHKVTSTTVSGYGASSWGELSAESYAAWSLGGSGAVARAGEALVHTLDSQARRQQHTSGIAARIELTAQTAVASTVHHPFGSPTGPGLFRVKGLQLPAYIQNVAHALMRSGNLGEGRAIGMAVGIVKNWAAGHDGHGHKVSADVQAAAAKAIAEWEADKARAHAHTSDGGRAAIELVGPKGYEHGWIYVGVAAGKLTADGDVTSYKNNLGYDRAEMPQLSGTVHGEYVPSKVMLPKFIAALRAKGIPVTEERVPAHTLSATQTTGDSPAIRGIADNLKSGELADTKPITVSADNRVLDGHHNWAGRMVADAEGGRRDLPEGMRVVRVGLPMDRLIGEAREFGKTHGIAQRKTGQMANPKYAKPAALANPGGGRMVDLAKVATGAQVNIATGATGPRAKPPAAGKSSSGSGGGSAFDAKHPRIGAGNAGGGRFAKKGSGSSSSGGGSGAAAKPAAKGKTATGKMTPPKSTGQAKTPAKAKTAQPGGTNKASTRQQALAQKTALQKQAAGVRAQLKTVNAQIASLTSAIHADVSALAAQKAAQTAAKNASTTSSTPAASTASTGSTTTTAASTTAASTTASTTASTSSTAASTTSSTPTVTAADVKTLRAKRNTLRAKAITLRARASSLDAQAAAIHLTAAGAAAALELAGDRSRPGFYEQLARRVPAGLPGGGQFAEPGDELTRNATPDQTAVAINRLDRGQRAACRVTVLAPPGYTWDADRLIPA